MIQDLGASRRARNPRLEELRAVPGICWNQDRATPGARLEKPQDVTGREEIREQTDLQHKSTLTGKEGTERPRTRRVPGSDTFLDPPCYWIRHIPGSATFPDLLPPQATPAAPAWIHSQEKWDLELFPVFPALPRALWLLPVVTDPTGSSQGRAGNGNNPSVGTAGISQALTESREFYREGAADSQPRLFLPNFRDPPPSADGQSEEFLLGMRLEWLQGKIPGSVLPFPGSRCFIKALP